jgi:glycerate-2-kinase
VTRRLIICDAESARGDESPDLFVGEHPLPGSGSLAAARALLSFLDTPSNAESTLFLLSGGASSLCSLPEEPLDFADLHGVWDAALATGIDITVLNKIRAATSRIAGGAVLRHVHTPTSQNLIMVDNAVSGAEWVGSGLTYEYTPDRSEVDYLLSLAELNDTPLGEKLIRAFETRASTMARRVTTSHENTVTADPDMLLQRALEDAGQRGYRVINMGSDVHGDVREVCEKWANVLEHLSARDGPYCLVGVGEVTVKVLGQGIGGRCQEFAWTMAGVLDHLDREAAFAARASDGRDFLRGVAGAWVDTTTKKRAHAKGIDWLQLKQENDSYRGLLAVDQLLKGGHTGWNLCDLYVAVI